MRKLLTITTILTLCLAGCSTIPPQLVAPDLANVTPKQAANGASHGERVRWGGKILKVTPNAHDTCFEVLSRALDANARPKRRGHSDGRFIACRDGFYDPELYQRHRDLTVVGRISGTEKHKVGGYDYSYARVQADQVYLWPERRRRPAEYYHPYYYDPFWGPYWWGSGWWAPPVIVVPPRSGHPHHGH